MAASLDRIRTTVINELASATTRDVAIDNDTCIVRDLDIDSLAVMNLILRFEDEYDVSMPLDRVAQIETVGDLVNTITSLAGERAIQ